MFIKDIPMIFLIVLKGTINHVLFTVVSWLPVLSISATGNRVPVYDNEHYAIFVVFFSYFIYESHNWQDKRDSHEHCDVIK